MEALDDLLFKEHGPSSLDHPVCGKPKNHLHSLSESGTVLEEQIPRSSDAPLAVLDASCFPNDPDNAFSLTKTDFRVDNGVTMQADGCSAV